VNLERLKHLFKILNKIIKLRTEHFSIKAKFKNFSSLRLKMYILLIYLFACNYKETSVSINHFIFK